MIIRHKLTGVECVQMTNLELSGDTHVRPHNKYKMHNADQRNEDAGGEYGHNGNPLDPWVDELPEAVG